MWLRKYLAVAESGHGLIENKYGNLQSLKDFGGNSKRMKILAFNFIDRKGKGSNKLVDSFRSKHTLP